MTGNSAGNFRNERRFILGLAGQIAANLLPVVIASDAPTRITDVRGNVRFCHDGLRSDSAVTQPSTSRAEASAHRFEIARLRGSA